MPNSRERQLTERIESRAARLTTQIAVVGSGPGGAITAALLAEAGREILLVEEGSDWPLDSCPPFSRQELVQKYRNGGITVAMGAGNVSYVEGCCVGGGSEINSGLYHRLPSDRLASWRLRFQVSQLSSFVAIEETILESDAPDPASKRASQAPDGERRSAPEKPNRLQKH
jgi:choline dehydrogenase-like flavoprotein